MERFDVINYLIQKRGYKSYLEIGHNSGYNFRKINASRKISVDPDDTLAKPIFKGTSNAFFKQNDEKFDIIFVDGLHHAEQVYKDIVNSLKALNDGGIIVCHDMLPPTKEHAAVPRIQQIWNGDCYKAFVQIRTERNDLLMRTIDTDWGLGLIQKLNEPTEYQFTTKGLEINFDNYFKNRNQWMNVIDKDEFLKLY